MSGLFIFYLWSDPRWFFAAAYMAILSICVHEFCHAYVALKLGDDTAARAGHLSLNPFRQMGWWSLIMLLFFGVAWGQVPVDLTKLHSKSARVAVALAGVGGNLLLALLLVGATYAVARFGGESSGFALEVLYYGATLNFLLLLFNLLPVPGLDGFAAISRLFPLRVGSEFWRGALWLAMLLVILSLKWLFAAAEFLTQLSLVGVDKLVKL